MKNSHIKQTIQPLFQHKNRQDLPGCLVCQTFSGMPKEMKNSLVFSMAVLAVFIASQLRSKCQTFQPYSANIINRLAEGILQTCIHYGPIAIKEPENYEARANLMWEP